MGVGSYFQDLVLATVPENEALIYGGHGGEGGPGAITYDSGWGTSVIRIRAMAPLEPGEDESWYRTLVFVPDASGDVGESDEYSLTVRWRLYRGDFTQASPALSGRIRVGYDYTAGTWIALPFGLAVSFSAGTIAASKRAYLYIYPARVFPPSYREINLSSEIFGVDGLTPAFGVQEVESQDYRRVTAEGRETRAPVSLRRNLWIAAEGVPIAVRTEILRWIEEGRRVAAFPYYNSFTRLLVPFQDSLRSYIGQQPYTYAGETNEPGRRGYFQDRSGIWRPSIPSAVACFENMEPLGRGLVLAEGDDNDWENLVYPSSPTGSGNLGWSASGVNDTTEFDAEVPLPVEADPGAVRWKVGASSTGLALTFSLATAAPGIFSVWVWGSSADIVTLEQTPAQGSVPRNSTTLTPSTTPQRVFVGVQGVSGSVTVKLTADEGSLLWVACAQGEECRDTYWGAGSITSCAWHGPTAYQRRLTASGDVERENTLWSIASRLAGYAGRVSFFWRPNFIGGSTTGGIIGMAASSTSDFFIAMTDADGDGDPEIRAYIRSGQSSIVGITTAELADVDPTTVFFVVFTYRVVDGDLTLRLEVFYDGAPEGIVATSTSGDSTCSVAVDLEAHSVGRWHGTIALLRVDADSHISSPPGTGDESYWARRQYEWWTRSETKEIAKILFGREYEIVTGEQAPFGGDSSHVNLPLTLVEARTDEYTAVYKGRAPGEG